MIFRDACSKYYHLFINIINRAMSLHQAITTRLSNHLCALYAYPLQFFVVF